MPLQQVFKTKNIIRITPEDTLAHALTLLSSSHDAAFVMEDKKLLGIINPYYCLIKKSFPANTKARHSLVHPPHIDIDTPLKKVIQMMIDSRIHYLPVLSHNEFYGIISARRILSTIQNTEELHVSISEYLKSKHRIISIYEKDSLAQAIGLFKKYKISKLVVLSNDLKLRGILAHYDLIAYLTSTKRKDSRLKQKDGKNTPLAKQLVKNFMKSTIITASLEHHLSDVAKLILDKQIGSVIVVDKERHPIGIITTKDLLSMYTSRKPKISVEVVTRRLSDKSLQIVKPFIQQTIARFNKEKSEGDKVKIIVQEKETGGVFKAIVSIIHNNNMIVIRREGKNLVKLLNTIKEKLKK